MIYLSNSAIQYAVNLCVEFEGLKAIIVSPDSDTRNRVAHYLRSIILQEDEDDPQLKLADNTYLLRFPNGSFIKVIGASANIHASRAHLLVVDINTDKEIVNNVLKPLETLPYRPYSKSGAWYMIP